METTDWITEMDSSMSMSTYRLESRQEHWIASRDNRRIDSVLMLECLEGKVHVIPSQSDWLIQRLVIQPRQAYIL